MSVSTQPFDLHPHPVRECSPIHLPISLVKLIPSTATRNHFAFFRLSDNLRPRSNQHSVLVIEPSNMNNRPFPVGPITLSFNRQHGQKQTFFPSSLCATPRLIQVLESRVGEVRGAFSPEVTSERSSGLYVQSVPPSASTLFGSNDSC